MASNVVDLFIRLNGLAQTQQGLKSVSSSLVDAKQEQKRLSLSNQQLALKERISVQELRVENAKRAVILRGSSADITRSIAAQNSLNQALRQQEVIKRRLANFDREVSQTGSTGWDSLRKILQGSGLPPGVQSLTNGLIDARSAFSSLGSTATKGIGSSLLATGALTAAIGVGLVGAIGAASAAVSYLINDLADTRTELDRIQERTKLQSIFETDRSTGFKLQERNEKLVQQLTNSSLSKESVLTLQGSFVDDFRSKNPTLSSDDVFKRTIGIAQGFTAIQQASGQDVNQLRRNIDDIVSGTRTANQIDNLEFFTNLSPSQKKTFKEVYNKKGGLAALEAVATMGETLLLIKEGADSTSARFNKIQETLFGDRFGLLSVDRDLDLSKEGYQNVRSEFNRSLDLIFGNQGLFATLGNIFGGSGDIMADIMVALTEFNNLIKSINDTLSIFKKPEGYRKFEEERNQAFDKRRQEIEIQRSNTAIDKFMQSFPIFRFGEWVATNTLKSFKPIAPNYQGLIQSSLAFKPAYNGFQGAYSTELRNKPPGTAIGLLYNTGEDILPPGMLDSFLRSSYARGASNGRSVSVTIAEGAIQIITQPGQDPKAIADYAIAKLISDIQAEIA